jgi:hypothetical protein
MKKNIPSSWVAVGLVKVRPTPDFVLDKISKHFDISLDALLEHKRAADIVMVRHITFYFLRKYCEIHLTKIGKMFNRDHTTVIHGVRKVKTLLEIKDAEYTYHVKKIKKLIKSWKVYNKKGTTSLNNKYPKYDENINITKYLRV